MKIRKGFVVREVAGNIVAVPTEGLLDEFNGIINLNESGEFIWNLLEKEDFTIDEVAKKYAEKYELDFDKAKEKVEKFVNQLIQANLIEQ